MTAQLCGGEEVSKGRSGERKRSRRGNGKCHRSVGQERS